MTKASTIAHLKGIKKLKSNKHPYVSEDLTRMFKILREHIEAEGSDMKTTVNSDYQYELWTEREITVKSRRRKGVMFASLVLYEDYVGLYFQPLYLIPDLTEHIPQGLLPLKRGVTCFHFQALNKSVLADFDLMLREGAAAYRSLLWT